MAIPLTAGDKAPDFAGVDQNGKSIQLSDFSGKKLILYFYPKDDTPGCTKEACNFRDNHTFWLNKGFEVVGVSPDSEASQQKFINKYDLPFSLIADQDKSVMTAYQTFGEKNMYGKIVMGVLRTTYVIDEEGTIISVIKRPKTAEHTEQITKLLEKEGKLN